MKHLLILRQRDFNQFQGLKLWGWYALIFAAFIWMGWLYFFDESKDIFSLIQPSLIGLFVVFYMPFVRKQKVEISEFGIKYTGGYPNFLKKYDSDWSVSWEEVESASLEKINSHPNHINTPLVIKFKNTSRKLIPSQWVDPTIKSRLNPNSLFRMLFQSRKLFLLTVKNSQLVKVFAEKGLLKEGTNSGSEWTDLNSNPVALGFALFFMASICYYIFEVYFGLSEFYIENPPYLWMILFGAVIGFLAYKILQKSELKFLEKIIIPVLVGFGTALVAYPLLLRANEWTDTEGLRSYSYKLIEQGVWVPAHNNMQLPNLTFDLQSSRYWQDFKIGTVKKYELRKGGLDFYQVNMDPIYEEQRVFYKNKDSEKND